MNVVMKEVKIGMGRREWRLPGLLYADDLVLCSELKQELNVGAENFV